jgi:hypothetical protein
MPRIAPEGEWPKNCKIPAGLRHDIVRHARALSRACIQADTDLSYRDADNLRVRVTLPDYSHKRRKRKKAK